jgi:Xaa-Pro aminopeptidase
MTPPPARPLAATAGRAAGDNMAASPDGVVPMQHRLTGKEKVGPAFDLDAMRHASAQSWRGVERMVAAFRPGLRESEAHGLARSILVELGMERIWHPPHIRFGANTTKKYNEKSEGDPVLGEDDIYFIDIGPVFGGHEGDVGATFTTGDDPAHHACAAAVKQLFDDTRAAWKEHALTGPALYDYAEARAKQLGWVLNLDITGHRVSDFPHAIHRGGDLGDYERTPTPGVWILEIQIVHPSRPFGGFYEDLLI